MHTELFRIKSTHFALCPFSKKALNFALYALTIHILSPTLSFFVHFCWVTPQPFRPSVHNVHPGNSEAQIEHRIIDKRPKILCHTKLCRLLFSKTILRGSAEKRYELTCTAAIKRGQRSQGEQDSEEEKWTAIILLILPLGQSHRIFYWVNLQCTYYPDAR